MQLLQVDYKEKFYESVDYKATFRVFVLILISVRKALDDPSVGDYLESEFAKYLQVLFIFVSIAVGHKISYRTGDFELQAACLATFSPLIIAAGKDKYASSVAHFLTDLDYAKQGLYDDLCGASAYNAKACGRYFALDEILEVQVGVTKRMMNPRALSTEDVKTYLRGAQSYTESFTSFCNDGLPAWADFTSQRVPTGPTISDRLRETANDLVKGIRGDTQSNSLQGLQNSASYPFLNDLLACVTYRTGIRRMETICRQDVLGIEERDGAGRRSTEYVRARKRAATTKVT